MSSQSSNPISRNVTRNGAQGTQTSPSAANFPAMFQSLQAQGMVLPGGMQNTETEIVFEKGKDPVEMQVPVPGNNIPKGTVGNIQDDEIKSDALRSALNSVKPMPGASYDRRAQAFLGGSNDSVLAIRQANAAQGFVRQNGRNIAIDSSGNPLGEFNEQGRQALLNDGSKTTAGDEFLQNYMKGATTSSTDSKDVNVTGFTDTDVSYDLAPAGMNLSQLEIPPVSGDFYKQGTFSTFNQWEPLMRFKK